MKTTYQSEFNWWQRALSILLGMWRINDTSIDFKWGYFAPRFGFKFIVNRGGYFDQTYSINFCLIWGEFQVKLPFKTRIPESCDTPRYGIDIHGNTFWIHLGGKMNSWEQCDSKWITWDLPFFSWVFDWHKVKMPDGKWELVERCDFGYREKVYTETHPYTYVLRSGEIQEREATCYVEERQWHRKWFPFARMNSRVINIDFSDEVGEGTGSWKGGTVGCSYDLKEGETIKECLKRMESEREFRR